MTQEAKPRGAARAILLAVLAALLYALSIPAGKLLLRQMSAGLLAAMLYLGAGLGMAVKRALRAPGKARPEPMGRADLPYAAAMVALDIAAPLFLLLGLKSTLPQTASLLNNFEIVATSLIALLFFGERISRRLRLAIGLVTLASLLLSLDPGQGLRLSAGSLLILLAASCWGLENNCTRMLSHRDSEQIVVVKGLGSGLGALLVALLIGDLSGSPLPILLSLLLGFVSFGLSISFYVQAQHKLGAARTSAFYSLSPFLGVALAGILFSEAPPALFYPALLLMALATWLLVCDSLQQEKQAGA